MKHPNGYSIVKGGSIDEVQMPGDPVGIIIKEIDERARAGQFTPGAVVITWSGGFPVYACVAPEEEGGPQE